MGFHRRSLEIKHAKGAVLSLLEGDLGSSASLNHHYFKDRNPEELAINRRIRDALPSKLDPYAIALDKVVDKHLWQLNGAHINAILHGLATNKATQTKHLPESLEGRRVIAEKLVAPLMNQLRDLKIWEGSCILQSLGILGVKDSRLSQRLLERFVTSCQFAEPLDFCQTMRGIVDIGLRSSRHVSLTSKITAHAFLKIDEFSATQLQSLIGSFAAYNCFDKRILDHYCEQALLSSEPLTLQVCGRLAHDFSKLGYRNDKFFDFIQAGITDFLVEQKIELKNTTDIAALAQFSRGLDVLEYSLNPLIATCLSRVIDSLPSNSSDYWSGIARSEAYPVLFVRGMPIKDRLLDSLIKFQRANNPLFGETSYFEQDVGSYLENLGYSFMSSLEYESFNLDFLITLPSGQRINLESDGDVYHLVRRLDDLSITPEYSARNKYRDLYLDSRNIPVVRILQSEWRRLSSAERCQLIEDKISAVTHPHNFSFVFSSLDVDSDNHLTGGRADHAVES
jgi:hypothetical protein